mgnify:CR=1 FL=1
MLITNISIKKNPFLGICLNNFDPDPDTDSDEHPDSDFLDQSNKYPDPGSTADRDPDPEHGVCISVTLQRNLSGGDSVFSSSGSTCLP